MILQKLASAIRRQDWFQVLIEVLIVIVGIFLGLQVQAWYQFQNDRQLEQVYLQRLLDDADASIAALERNITLGEEKIENLKTVNQLMLNHQVNEDSREVFSDSFFSSRGFSSMDVYLTTIDELVSSGQVTLIQSQEIRNAIGILRKEYDVLNFSQRRASDQLGETYSETDDLIKADVVGGKILNPLEELNGDNPIFRKMRTLRELNRRHQSLNVRMTNYIKEYREILLNELEKTP